MLLCLRPSAVVAGQRIQEGVLAKTKCRWLRKGTVPAALDSLCMNSGSNVYQQLTSALLFCQVSICSQVHTVKTCWYAVLWSKKLRHGHHKHREGDPLLNLISQLAETAKPQVLLAGCEHDPVQLFHHALTGSNFLASLEDYCLVYRKQFQQFCTNEQSKHLNCYHKACRGVLPVSRDKNAAE